MKDLIAISAYCPDITRKKILLETLTDLQGLRDKFDLLLVSHSPIDTIYSELIDYSYYDSDNELLTDFDLTNRFVYKDPVFFIRTSQIYTKSTHLAIYRLIYYAFNFANFMGYKKVHYMEYDFDSIDFSTINQVNQELDISDAIMFRDLDDTNFIIGSYWATTTKNLNLIYDRDEILSDYKFCRCVTESTTPYLLKKFNKEVVFWNTKILNQDVYQIAKYDSHDNQSFNWAVPLYNSQSGLLTFFVYNKFDGDFEISLEINDQPTFKFSINTKNCWYIQDFCEFDQVDKIKVYVNQKMRLDIDFNLQDKEKFIQNNFITNDPSYFNLDY